MKRLRIGIRRLRLAAACLVGFALASPAATPPPVRVKLSADHWTVVPIPAVSVAANGPTLWAGGLHGALFRSDDGGRTWQQVFHGRKDDFILDLDFPSPLVGVAVGSQGFELVSTDGGARWRKASGPPHIAEEVDYADATHGLILSLAAYLAPGWHKIRFTSKPPAHGSVGAAWLGVGRGCLVFGPDGQTRSQMIACSTGKGKPWNLHALPDLLLTGIVARSGLFWAVGIRLSGQPAPITARSADGTQWTVQRETRVPLDDCTAQGCLEVGGNAWTDPWASARVEASFPKSDAAVRQWAAVGGTICVAGLELRCALAKEQPIPATPVAPAGRPASLTDVQPLFCLRCRPPAYPWQDRQTGIQGRVDLMVELDPFGVPVRAEVLASPDRDLADACVRAVSKWRFRPQIVAGTPEPVAFAVEMGFGMNQ